MKAIVSILLTTFLLSSSFLAAGQGAGQGGEQTVIGPTQTSQTTANDTASRERLGEAELERSNETYQSIQSGVDILNPGDGSNATANANENETTEANEINEANETDEIHENNVTNETSYGTIEAGNNSNATGAAGRSPGFEPFIALMSLLIIAAHSTLKRR
jgi:hypothetical protein